ncbi:MAG: hypothetical protein ABR521_04035, partial [Gaiellaceae bacterium]
MGDKLLSRWFTPPGSTGPPAAADTESKPLRLLARSALLGGAGLALGACVVVVERQGVGGSRSALVVVALLVGVLAALAPLRYGLAIAIMAASLNGFLLDAGGSRAGYWNEAFAGLLVLRSCVQRRPGRWELLGVGAVAAACVLYLLAGHSPEAVFWGAKVLLTGAIVGWSAGRLGLGRREWDGLLAGLAVAVAANLTIAAWQRSEGVAALRELGFPAGRVGTKVGDDVVRAFGGLTSAASLSFVLGVAVLCWIASLLTGRQSRAAALSTAWLPVAVVLGLYWALSRTALFALCAAGVVVALRYAGHRQVLPLLLAVGVLGAAVLAVGGSEHRRVLTEPLSPSSPENRFRISLWRAYLDEFSIGGAGPASAGSAYVHVHDRPPRPLPIHASGIYDQRYTAAGVDYWWFWAERALIFVRRPPGRYPPPRLEALVTSYEIPRTLTVRRYFGRQVVRRLRIPSGRFVRLSFPIPRGGGELRFIVEVSPPPRPADGRGELGRRPVGFQLRDPHL